MEIDLKEMIREAEKKWIVWSLKEANGHKANAARLLGLQRTTLVEKMRRHGLKLNERSGMKPRG